MNLSSFITHCKNGEKPKSFTPDELILSTPFKGGYIFAKNTDGQLTKLAHLMQSSNANAETIANQLKAVFTIPAALKTESTRIQAAIINSSFKQLDLSTVVTTNPYRAFGGSSRSVASEPAPAVGHQSSPTVSSRSF